MGIATGSTDSPNPPNVGGFTSCSSRAVRRSATAREIIDRLRPELAKCRAPPSFWQTIAGASMLAPAPAAAAFSTRCRIHITELNRMVAEDAGKMRTLPNKIADASSDLWPMRRSSRFTINRDQASRFRHLAATDQRYAQRRLRPGARSRQYFTQLNTYFVILEILPELQTSLELARPALREIALTGDRGPLSALIDMDSSKVGPLS